MWTFNIFGHIISVKVKNVTLSMPEDLIQRGRSYAKKHGTTLNEMIRDLLRKKVLNDSEDSLSRIIALAEEMEPEEECEWNRNEAHDR